MTRLEQIARIVDPSSWRVLDSYLEQAKRKYAGQDAGYDPEAFRDRASLAIAAQIIALDAVPGEDEVEAVKDIFRDYIDEYDDLEIASRSALTAAAKVRGGGE